MNQQSRNTGRILFTMMSGLWFVFMVCHVIFTGKISLWNFFGSLPTVLFGLISLLFLLVELAWKRRSGWGILLASFSLILGITQIDLNVHMNPESKQVSQRQGSTRIKIFNWNTNCWDQHKSKDKFYQFLKKQQADIYILQEYLHGSIDWSDPKVDKSKEMVDRSKLFRICSVVPGFPIHYLAIDDRERLRKEFPGYEIRTDLQFVVISRFPILSSHADYSEQYAVTDVNINGRPVRLFNIHILLHIEPENPLKPYFYQALHRRFLARQLAFKNLKADISSTKIDYLIAGDFNSTKAMGVMNDLLQTHNDAAQYSTSLFPLTFEFGGVRWWRFDYELTPKTNSNIRILSYQNLEHYGLSDHNPQSLIVNIETGHSVAGDRSKTASLK